MLIKSWHKKQSRKGKSVGAASALLCFLLGIQAVTALARVDNNWSQRRPNAAVAQNHWGQAGGNRQQHLSYNRNNQTQFQPTTIRPGAAAIGFRNNQTLPIRNQSNYPSYPITHRGALNQTQPNWSQTSLGPRYQAHGQGTFNRTHTGWPQPQLPNQPAYPVHGETMNNYSRPIHNVPVGPAYPNQPRLVYVPQNPSHGQVSFNQSQPSWLPVGSAYPNQSRPAWPQPSVPYVPQNPPHGQGSFNQSQPSWPQPSAPQQPNYPYNPALPASNLYPQLPNNPNTKPVVPSHSWTPPANQTHLYPQLPNQNLPSGGNSNGIPLAPLQPQANPQGPHNWHSGGQAPLSYGPGYYPPAAVNTNNNNPSKPQGSSNPYANMFI